MLLLDMICGSKNTIITHHIPPSVNIKLKSTKKKTYTPSLSLRLTVVISIGCLIIFLYVGNCLVFTGLIKGQLSSWPANSVITVTQIPRSLSGSLSFSFSAATAAFSAAAFSA